MRGITRDIQGILCGAIFKNFCRKFLHRYFKFVHNYTNCLLWIRGVRGRDDVTRMTRSAVN